MLNKHNYLYWLCSHWYDQVQLFMSHLESVSCLWAEAMAFLGQSLHPIFMKAEEAISVLCFLNNFRKLYDLQMYSHLFFMQPPDTTVTDIPVFIDVQTSFKILLGTSCQPPPSLLSLMFTWLGTNSPDFSGAVGYGKWSVNVILHRMLESIKVMT